MTTLELTDFAMQKQSWYEFDIVHLIVRWHNHEPKFKKHEIWRLYFKRFKPRVAEILTWFFVKLLVSVNFYFLLYNMKLYWRNFKYQRWASYVLCRLILRSLDISPPELVNDVFFTVFSDDSVLILVFLPKLWSCLISQFEEKFLPMLFV